MEGLQLKKIQQAIFRYLLGKGHPYPGRVAGLVNMDAFDDEQHDPLFRTRRFIKVTSGLTTLPSDDRKFTVSVFGCVSTDVPSIYIFLDCVKG